MHARTRAALTRDLVLFAVVAAATSLEVVIIDGTDQDGTAALMPSLVIWLAMCVAVVASRRFFPISTLFVTSGIGAWLGGGFTLAVLAAYGVGYRERRTGIAFTAIALAATVPSVANWWFVLRFRGQQYDLVILIAVSLLLTLVPGLIARYRRERSDLMARETALLAEQARLRERARIAQDMHDTLGHDLALISLQAGALEVDAGLPERNLETVRLVRRTASDATARLREIIGVLHDADDPGIGDSVEALVDRSRKSGMVVRLEMDSVDSLGGVTEQALRRVVQESLTNAAKHAPGAPVTIRIRPASNGQSFDTGLSDLTAIDADITSGPRTRPPSYEMKGGRGLIGLSERVRLAGGAMQAGPHNGGFRVSVRLPRRSEVDLDAPAPAPLEAVNVRLRRGFWVKLVAPILLMLLVTAAYFVVFGLRQATLSQTDYDGLRVGQSEERLLRTLPAGIAEAPEGLGREAAPPQGATCRYYLPRTANWLDLEPDEIYRVCFQDGKLLQKNRFPTNR